MAHLTINAEGWKALPHGTFGECADIAQLLGLDPADVKAVLIDGAPLDEHFIACCLYYLPVEFADLFGIVPPLVVAA